MYMATAKNQVGLISARSQQCAEGDGYAPGYRKMLPLVLVSTTLIEEQKGRKEDNEVTLRVILNPKLKHINAVKSRSIRC
jgi:hypothetical protein